MKRRKVVEFKKEDTMTKLNNLFKKKEIEDKQLTSKQGEIVMDEKSITKEENEIRKDVLNYFSEFGNNGKLSDETGSFVGVISLLFIIWGNGLKEEMERIGIIEPDSKGFTPKQMVDLLTLVFPKSKPRFEGTSVASTINKVYNKIEYNSRRVKKPIGLIFKTNTLYTPHKAVSLMTTSKLKELMYTNKYTISYEDVMALKMKLTPEDKLLPKIEKLKSIKPFKKSVVSDVKSDEPSKPTKVGNSITLNASAKIETISVGIIIKDGETIIDFNISVNNE